ncbi:NAD(P)H-hydrate dehydratase [Endothiovibrio diazotrophicus]
MSAFAAEPQLPVNLYRAAQVRELDRRAIEERGLPGGTLMERAGQATFDALRRRWPEAQRIAVLCGIGNNGGDGFVIARLARLAGLEVRLFQLGDPAALKGDARVMAEAWHGYGGESRAFDAAALGDAEVIVDALFGTGLERPLEGAWREAVEAMEAAPAPVVAVDIPSGLHADRGVVLGAAPRAALTVSFIGLKPGLFTGQGPDYCGEVVFNDLQVPAAVYDGIEPAARRCTAAWARGELVPRRRDAHKGAFGHLLVIGGDYGMAGAARLAAEAALRAGAGLVSVATRPEHAVAMAAAVPELMCRGVCGADELEPLLERATVIAVGPGLGRSEWAESLLAAALTSHLSVVVDADALNLLAGKTLRRDDWVLTPHPGEASRLLGCATAEVQADRLAAAAGLASRYGGVAVLKGAGSLIQVAGGVPALCAAGNPGMAAGGMGDVLTGVIGALLAQGFDGREAAELGVCLHAGAADLAAADGERGMTASDLIGRLRALVNPPPPAGGPW